MPTRKSHTKSRHGCLQCKRRKVRCDHAKPICGNCTKRQEKCEYRLNLETAHVSGPLSVGNRSNNASPSAPLEQENPLGLNLEDLELLHHFTTETYRTLTGDEETRRMWQNRVPKEACKHAFLMHCILSLSALHISTIEGPARFGVAAAKHHDRGLSSFRPMLNIMNGENCNAIFAASSLLVTFASAAHRLTGVERRPPAIHALLELIELTKGVHAVVLSGWDEIRAGWLFPMLHPIDWLQNPVAVPQDTSAALDRLEVLVRTTVEDETAVSHYLAGIKGVLDNFRAIILNPGHYGLVLLFLTFVEREFAELVQTQDPLALVILAHYGTVLHMGRDRWWISDWGYLIVNQARNTLDDSWRPSIAWPIEKVGLDIGT